MVKEDRLEPRAECAIDALRGKNGGARDSRVKQSDHAERRSAAKHMLP